MKSSLGNQLEDMKRLAEGEARDKVLFWKFFMSNDYDGDYDSDDDGNDDWEASGEVTFSKNYLLHQKYFLVTSGGVVILW